jgi:hypothetical protein
MSLHQFCVAAAGMTVVLIGVAGGEAWAGTGATTVDFNDRPAGTRIDNQYAYHGVLLSVHRLSSGPDVLTLYNTGQKGEPDTDLQLPFDAGNLAPTGPGGNILIIPEYDTDRDKNGLIDQPNDEGSRPSGEMHFEFPTPITSFGFDLIDVEGPAEYNKNAGFLASFYRNGNLERRVGFGEFISPTSPFYDPTVKYGNNSANRIRPITALQLGLPYFDEVVLSFGGSGGTDNLRFTLVPEPTGMVLIALGAAGLLARRRQRI